MNRFTAYPLRTEKTSKFFTIIMLLCCFIPVILNCVVISPLYMTLNADVLFSDSAIIYVLDYTMDFMDIIAFSVSYALIIFSVFFLSKNTTRLVVLLYTLAFFLQIPLKIFMNIPINGSIGSVEEIIIDIIYLSVYFILFMIQLLVIYIFATTDTNKYLRYIEFSKKKKGKDLKEQPLVLPFKRFLDFSNPLHRSTLKMGVLIFALRVFSRLVNDISYGAPTSIGEVIIMIAYYRSDAVYGIVAYIIALLIFTLLYEKLSDRKADEAIAPSADNF